MYRFWWFFVRGSLKFVRGQNDHIQIVLPGSVAKGFSLFIGTCLVTHALSCVHSAFASCGHTNQAAKSRNSVDCAQPARKVVEAKYVEALGVLVVSAARHRSWQPYSPNGPPPTTSPPQPISVNLFAKKLGVGREKIARPVRNFPKGENRILNPPREKSRQEGLCPPLSIWAHNLRNGILNIT